MSIPNRQIGWSQESNLLSYISKQLDKLNGTVAATAAGGLLNPTTNYIPFNSGLAFGDSFLVNDAPNNIIKTSFNSQEQGFKFDFFNLLFYFGNNYGADGSLLMDNNNGETFLYNRFVRLGSQNNGIYLEIDDYNSRIQTQYGGNDTGLTLDFVNNHFTLGDSNGNNNGIGLFIDETNRLARLGDIQNAGSNTVIIVDDNSALIKTQYGGNDIGLFLNFINNTFYLGDSSETLSFLRISNSPYPNVLQWSNNTNTNSIEQNNGYTSTYWNGIETGLKLDFASQAYRLGENYGANGSINVDVLNNEIAIYDSSIIIGSTSGNITQLKLRDAQSDIYTEYNGNDLGLKLDFSSNKYTFGSTTEYIGIDTGNNTLIAGANLTSATAGGASGQHLKININGTNYKIALLNN